MTLPSPSGMAVGETGDPGHVVTPDDPLADAAPPAEDAGGDPPEEPAPPLLHAAKTSAEAPSDDASSPLLSPLRARVPMRTSGPYQRRSVDAEPPTSQRASQATRPRDGMP